MLAAVPAVEVAGNAYARGLRRPHRKLDTARASLLREVRAELLVNLFVLAFAEEIKIDLAERRGNWLVDLFAHQRAATGSAMREKISAPLPLPGRLLFASATNSRNCL